jgi:hypothetical protein
MAVKSEAQGNWEGRLPGMDVLSGKHITRGVRIMATQETKTAERREYHAPELRQWGSVADITQVGQTRPGDDVLPGDAKGKDGGSINPSGLD